MNDVLPQAVADGLKQARRAAERKSSRLHIELGETRLRVLRKWDTGFAIAAEDAPQLRGLVDLYDGGHHLYQCLIVKAAEVDGEWHYEFKRNTIAADRAPLDYVRADDAPVGYLPAS